MKLWIALHRHANGADVYPFFQDQEPSIEQIRSGIGEYNGRPDGADDFDPESPDYDEREWIEIRGPFDLPGANDTLWTTWKCPECGTTQEVEAYQLAEIGTPHCCDCEDIEMVPDDDNEGTAEDTEVFCPESPSSCHAPDPTSIRPADGAGRNCGTDWIVEVVCKHCERLGSLRIDPGSIRF